MSDGDSGRDPTSESTPPSESRTERGDDESSGGVREADETDDDRRRDADGVPVDADAPDPAARDPARPPGETTDTSSGDDDQVDGGGDGDVSAGSGTDVDVDALTGPARRLDPRVRYVWLVGSAFGAAIFGGVTGAVGYFAFESVLVGPAVFAVTFLLGAVFAVLRYRSWRYEIREDSLFLERGVITHTKTVVPYVRIQHVDASRGPAERLFGLATAVVYTAGSRGADVSIPGLAPDRADDLQERLKRLAIAAEGEDAV